MVHGISTCIFPHETNTENIKRDIVNRFIIVICIDYIALIVYTERAIFSHTINTDKHRKHFHHRDETIGLRLTINISYENSSK